MSDRDQKDVIIVGAGPAGISCGLALQQLGYAVTVVEGGSTCGGRLRSIPQEGGVGDRSPDAAQALNLAALGQALEVRLLTPAVGVVANEESIRLTLGDGTQLVGRYLVLACGVSHRDGGLDSRPGRIFGPQHPPLDVLIPESDVAILGGGDSAFQSYLAFRRLGARSVTVFARTLRARAQLATAVPECDIRLGGYEVSPLHNQIDGRPYDLVHVCYGYEVSRAGLLGLDIALTDSGLVQTDGGYESSIRGIFAIGDMAGRMRPSSAAAFAEGLIVARELQRRLDGPVLQALNERLANKPPVRQVEGP